jgi:ribosomal protein S18 acetylase RimI-like enzyme
MMVTSDILIRNATANDSDVIVLFIRAMLQDMASVGGHDVNPDETFWSRFLSTIVESIQEADRLYLLAEVSGTIVGYIEGKSARLYDVFAPKKSFHISGVYVVPERRRQGIATMLVQEALQWAVGQECQEADLNVLLENQAKGFYEKLGFGAFQHEMRMELPTLHGGDRTDT